MAASKRCVICLNYLKSKKKLIPKHSLEEQTMIMYFLRKLALTPIPDDNLKTFLKVGNPSEWASFCYICEGQVKKCYDMHRKIMGMIGEIADIREKLYQENFYESDDEDEEESGSGKRSGFMDVFNQLRQQLFSDFREGGGDSWQFDNLITLNYKTASDGELESSTAIKSPKVCIVKKEPVYEDEDAEDPETFDESYYLEDDNNNSNSEESSREESRHASVDVGGDGTVDDEPSSTQVDEELDEIFTDKSSKKCPRCRNTFHSHAALRRHFKGTHLQVRDVRCPICAKTFARKEYILSHIHLLHPERIGELEKFGLRTTKEYLCPQCPSKFGVSRALRKHINKFHKDGSQRYPCDECDKLFKNKGHLRIHKREIHCPVSSRKMWPCPQCGKQLRYKGGLARHIREKHERKNAFVCPHCGKTSSRKPDLERHIYTVHGSGNEKGIDASVKQYAQCNLCWKSYSNPEALALHQAAQHPEGKGEKGESQLQPQDEDSSSFSQEEASRSSEEQEQQFQSELREDEAMEEETLSLPQVGELRQLSLLEF